MIQYSAYKPVDAHEAVDLWNRAFGEPFPMDLRLWRQNVDDSSWTIREAGMVARDDEAEHRPMVGFLIVKSPKHISAVAVDPNYRRQGIASELLALSQQAIGADSQGPWVVGQDYNHFFPGVPRESVAAIRFFEAMLRYKAAERPAVDLARDLADFTIDPKVEQKTAELGAAGIVLCACAQADLSALADHINANYSGRWLTDTINRLNVETNPSEIMIAKRPATGQVLGFAHTYSNRSRYVGPPIYWRALLGPKYGGLGPIGVDQEHRKIGLGLALLSYAVQSVKDRGMTRMVIDWTDLVDFYGKVGFVPWKHYLAMRP